MIDYRNWFFERGPNGEKRQTHYLGNDGIRAYFGVDTDLDSTKITPVYARVQLLDQEDINALQRGGNIDYKFEVMERS